GLFNLVANLRGAFKIFVSDRFFELLLKRLQTIGDLRFGLDGVRALADVARAFVHRFEETFQAFAKNSIALGAAKSAGFFEIRLGEATVGAFGVATRGGLLHFLRGAEAEQKIGEREPGGVIDAFCLRATFAEIDLLGFPFDHLGQVNGRYVLFTNVAEHFDRFYIGPAPPQVKETLSWASGRLKVARAPASLRKNHTAEAFGKSGQLP